MKKLICFLFISSSLFAQSNITKVEYFVDADPGVDNATNVPITAGQNVATNFNFPITSLADGFHLLSIRAKNADNNWSATTYRPFVKFNLSGGSGSTPADITYMEYFIDADPGVGNGTSVPVTAGQSVENVSFNFPITSLSDGFHLLSIRARNSDNNWSATTYRPFVKFNLNSGSGSGTPANITYMEYFVGDDPGVGAGVSIPIMAGQSVDNVSFNVDLNGLANGIHLLSVRAKNADNQWSATTVDAFTKKDNIVSIGSVPAAFCRETAFDVPFVVSGTFGASNVFSLQLSNASGGFTSPTVLGTFTGNTSGTISASIPAGITVAPGYLLRIVASNPVDDLQPIKMFEVLEICPPPCAMSLNLVSTADDYNSGIVLKQVNNQSGTIEASNKISGTANVTYNAGGSIHLKPGFAAANGTVFLVEMGGCVE